MAKVYSMTGYGEANRMHGSYKIHVDIKTLNSKYSDVRLKLPADLTSMEMEIRQEILRTTKRGKVEVQLMVEGEGFGDEVCEIDPTAFTRYFEQMESLSRIHHFGSGDFVPALLQLPGVVRAKEFSIEEAMKYAIMETLSQALDSLEKYRETEGNALAEALEMSVRNIIDGREAILGLEEERMTMVKERLLQNLEKEIEQEKVDRDRFEQELIYYLDKLDIHEEMVRLEQHCEYFLEALTETDEMKGKKLNFISQEIGREINTLGAKASHAGIQRLVVVMKNELDKIKEQLANVL